MTKILITNDDGILGVGLEPLVKEISKIAKVTVVVPDREYSASSHSLNLNQPVKAREITRNTYILGGTPVDCVRFGILKLCRKNKPDIIISGINFGSNLGQDVIYSGTVAAAREGLMLNVSSFSISLVSLNGKNFSTAAKFASKLTKIILNNKLVNSRRILFNVNVPDIPLKKIRGVEITSLGKRTYTNVVVSRFDPVGLEYHWLKGPLPKSIGKNIPGTDINAIMNGKISITPLKIDTTDKEMLNKLKGLKFTDGI